jgi:hypothetical protein
MTQSQCLTNCYKGHIKKLEIGVQHLTLPQHRLRQILKTSRDGFKAADNEPLLTTNEAF